ncbi:MAG: signal recognition particle-docking protein FtsY [Desulfobacterales bacterium]|jgi:fused signal recognition particle receptor|nr:signal recognition particle-docking protein FtsY [Desulfobacterales bacterium]
MALRWFKKTKTELQASSNKHSASEAETVDTPAEQDETSAAVEPEGGAAVCAENTDFNHLSKPKNGGFFNRLKRGLTKTREFLTTDIDSLFTGKTKVDENFLEDLEGLLITADLGIHTVTSLMARVRKKVGKIKGVEDLKAVLREEILALISSVDDRAPQIIGPKVVMVVGVNGVGKTTTIGKLSARAVARGEKVLIAAADTFRAAAVEQLEIWANRAGTDFVKHREGTDPAAVAYDGYFAARSRGATLVFIDTAGRLHTKVNLMEELKKIKRSLAKIDSAAPHEVLLVLDATTGQNAVSQAKLFHEACGVTAMALTKLDGTAKGGVVVSICHEMNIPLRYIGVGESIEDLQDFDAEQFVKALI